METTNLFVAPAATAPKRRTAAILYWVLTLIIAAAMLLDGIAGLLRVEDGQTVMQHLGYPVYILSILGVAKVLGALALAQPRFRTLKEWAYAGFTINFLGAAASWAFVEGTLATVMPPLVALALLLVSYALWKKTTRAQAAH